MIALIIAVAVAYVTVGLLIIGFVGLSLWEDFMPFFGVLLLWPIVLGIFAVSAICAAPVRLGKKLGAKYRKIVEDAYNKLFNN